MKKLEGIILQSFEVSEVDRIYIIFSREKGKIKVLSKGVRKLTARLAYCLEPITYTEISLIEGRSWDRITGATLLNQYTGIKSNFIFSVETKKVLLKVEKMLQENNKVPELFDLLADYLVFLEKLSKQSKEAKKGKETNWKVIARLAQAHFFWQLIVQSGIKPEFYHCISCRNKILPGQRYNFLSPEGLICSYCLKNDYRRGKTLEVNENVIKTIRFLLSHPLKVVIKLLLNDDDLVKVERIAEDIIETTINK